MAYEGPASGGLKSAKIRGKKNIGYRIKNIE
jgi:hypothetical protein